MIFLYLKPHLVEHSYAPQTKHYLLLEPVSLVSAVEKGRYFAVLGLIFGDVGIKKKDRDVAARETLHIVQPCLDRRLPAPLSGPSPCAAGAPYTSTVPI